MEVTILGMSSFVSTILSNLTLSMVHTVVWIRSTIVTLYCWMALSLTSPFKHKGVKTDLILQDSKRLKKIPFHLAVVLCEDDIIYNDLSSIVCWAFSFGIQLVSIYDLKGLCALNNKSPFAFAWPLIFIL